MINLLPTDMKQGYRYARRNVLLRTWVGIFLLAFVGLGGIATFGLLQIHQSTATYSKQLAISQHQLQSENFTGVQKQAEDMSNTFKLVLKVLGNEVLFSQLLKQVASIIPDNANLTGLTIANTQGGIDITAVAKDYNTATQVQVNLADPTNRIFSKADIVSIDCGGAASTNPDYPCNVSIRALFAPNNPFLFINTKAKT